MKEVALITGASSGIGMELAHIHAQNRKDLILIARREDRLFALKRELEEKYNIQVLIIAKDLSLSSSPAEIFEQTRTGNIEIDYLINNAGFGGFGYFHQRSLQEDLDMVMVNITSLMLLTKLCLPGMIARGRGRILNLSSSASFMPGPMQAVYYATKAFVTSFSQAVSEEVRGSGVTVTTFCPGLVNTEFIDSSGMGNANIMRYQKPLLAKKTAVKGYKAMMKGKLVAFDRPLLKFTTRWLIPFIPRNFLLSTVRNIMDKRNS